MMRNMLMVLAGAMAMVLTAPLAAQAADAPASVFYGEYIGTGIAETKMPAKVAVTARDLDVTIKAAGDGFEVSWTTVEYKLQPGKVTSNRITSAVTFLPTPRKNIFKPAKPGDPTAEEAYYWARISGQTLTVFAVSINEKGDQEIASWARTLNGNRMELVFRRAVAGEPQRSVKGTLAKTK